MAPAKMERKERFCGHAAAQGQSPVRVPPETTISQWLTTQSRKAPPPRQTNATNEIK